MLEILISKLRFSERKPLVIVVAVVLLALIILGVVLIVKNQNQSSYREATIEKVSSELDNSLAACKKEKNPDYCAAKKVEAAALQVKAVEFCQKLDNSEDIDTCIWRVAIEDGDSEICKALSKDERKTDCQNLVYRNLAQDNFDLSWCEKINNEITRKGCISLVSEKIAREKGCQGTGIDQDFCDRLSALDQAIASRDPDQCMLLSQTDDQESCIDSVGVGDKDLDNLEADLEARLGTSDESLDSDVDGLSDYEEYGQYGTNPAQADSDGDGYNDSEEIKNGYNPLGSGKL